MKPRIALVDDDKNILASVSMALEAAGFRVLTYEDGAAALQGLSETPADLAVIDIKMPRMDGMELLKNIRARSAMPVIFLTSKNDEADQLAGLRRGADDYITKPFSQKLLLERIHVVLRRREQQGQSQGDPPPDNLLPQIRALGDLTLDDGRHLCLWKGSAVDMTVTEFLLMKALAEHPGHVKSREQLMDFAYGETLDADDRTIDSHIKRIRKKFRDVDPDFNAIETLYGAGYRYNHD